MSICENQEDCARVHGDVSFWREECAKMGPLIKSARKALTTASYWVPPASPMKDEVDGVLSRLISFIENDH